jgi:signal transduction histidine kinase
MVQSEYRSAVARLDISHEIKTSAQGIRSSANFVRRSLQGIGLKSERESDERLHKLSHIVEATNLLGDLLDQLNVPVPSESGSGGKSERGTVSFAPYADLCKPMFEMYVEEARQRKLHIQFQSQDQLGLVYAPLEDFRTIIRNLAHNAVKYTNMNETGALDDC